ncbi:MAG TPA: hypothetical protein PKE55_02580 [Kiritimatiellia bacterium]|nr:hypothetical protein [Kiritimatiellia bacterium]
MELVHGEDLSLTFDLINTSRDPITLGPTVKILLSCLHSDGTRSFQSPSHIALPSRPDLIRLQPGQSLTGTLTFESIDFSIIGLVEMRALVRVKDTRTYGQPSSWTGRVLSNGFGIHVQDPGAEAQGLAGAF